MPKRIKKIVIVGGGTAGWITASLLVKVLGKNLEITLIESEQIGTIGVGEATIPPLKRLNSVLGLDESAFVAETQGTFKLGIDFVNWSRVGERYMHTFGKVGSSAKFCDFASLWRRSLNGAHGRDFWDYSLHYQAAKNNKFAKIPKDIGSLPYAYHFDAGLYAKFLRRYSEQRGVTRVEGKINQVNTSDAGSITSVRLEGDKEIAGDFFIDCSGMRSLLLGEALGVPFEDWGQWLPCDRALAVQSKNIKPPPPYTVSTAVSAGWQWRIPLQHRTGNGLVFSSKYLSEDEAKSILLGNLEGEPIGEPRLIKFRTGMRTEQWRANCVGIGLAGGFIEPLESTSIHFIQRAVFKLIAKFPRNGIKKSEIDQYNAEFRREYYDVRDFIVLHYHLNQRDEAFWTQCREMEIPDTLRHKMELFRETATSVHDKDVLFSPSSWYQVMIGQGLIPEDYHPVADLATSDELDKILSHLKESIDQLVAKLPTHEQFISANCRAVADV